MKRSAFLVFLIGLFLLASCGNSEPKTNSPISSSNSEKISQVFPNDDSIPEDLIIRLNRTACYGTCPAYLLTVKADGKVSFFGQNFTETKGQAEGEISKEKIKELIQEFKKAKFFELNDNYTSEKCGTDNSTVRTTLFINDKVKKIEHDLGCEAPPELTNLEDKIDEIVGTKKWIGDKK
jgi:hypothetical protein